MDNMKFFRIIVTLSVLIAGLLPSMTASARENGGITGRITNGTDNTSIMAGYTVNLITYQDTVEMDVSRAVSGPDGYFTFSDLETDSGYSYILYTTYDSVDYYNGPLAFTDSTANLTADLEVYETEDTDEFIRIISSHVILYIYNDQLHIDEYYLFYNDSDRTYTGQVSAEDMTRYGTLKFTLPKTAQDLEATTGFINDDIVMTDSGFVTTVPIIPGMKEIAFSYAAGYETGEFNYTQDIYYPVGNMEFLVNGGNVEITTSQLEEKEQFQIEGNAYDHYGAENLMPGQRLDVLVSKGSAVNTGLIIILILVVILFVGVVAYIVYSRRNRPPESAPVPVMRVEDDMESLLNRLAQLDDDYDDGIIDENEYNRLRSDIKEKLTVLMSEPDGN